jgi:AcrR family transcriptional regulator
VSHPDRPVSRLAPEERRRQLVGIGLSLLATKPIQQLTVEEVARTAGISRNLLFHYFSTKREFYAEVVGAACRRLLRATAATSDGDPRERLTAFVDGYVGFVDRHPQSYASVLHRTGGDDWVRDIWEDCRGQLAATVLEILDRRRTTPLTRQAVRGWLSLVEDMTLAWSAEHTVARAALVALLVDAAGAVVALAERTSGGDS